MTSMDGTGHSETADVAGLPVGAGVLGGTVTFPAADSAAGRCAASIDSLFRLHHAELVRLAVLMVRDLPTAEDVVQDVFARIQARPDVRPQPGHELAYLRASVLNGCRSVYRRRAVAARLGLEPSPGSADWAIGRVHSTSDAPYGRAEPPPHESAEAEAIRADDCRRVLLALAGLPGRRREVLVLRYYVGLSEAEIAATLGISPGGVKSAASRGLAALARKLGEES
jgi:RNA polymerase sigma factor (sigma-70 family)